MNRAREHLAYLYNRHYQAKIIQRQWRASISNPLYLMCINRLINEFNQINIEFINL